MNTHISQESRCYTQLLTRLGEGQPEPRLHATARAVHLLGDPHLSCPVIHIAGTNGKTSTSRMIEKLLRSLDLKTGLFTSPHLLSFTERICLNGVPIAVDDLDRIWDEISPILDLVDAEYREKNEEPLTFFEAMTVLAFAVFADFPVDVMVLETGMGGEWDSTNVAVADVCVFTPVALDHEKRLGSSVSEIAKTKSGIIKEHSLVVSAQQDPLVEEILRKKALALHSEFFIEGSDFVASDVSDHSLGFTFNARCLSEDFTDIFLPLFGYFQVHNAVLAISAVNAFLRNGNSSTLKNQTVRTSLASVTSPGRRQTISLKPPVIIDAAHNPHGAHALVNSLLNDFKKSEFGVVFGILEDKDLDGFVKEISRLEPIVFLSDAPSERAVSSEKLLTTSEKSFGAQNVSAHTSVLSAYENAKQWAGSQKNRIIVVTGSLSVISEILKETGTMKSSQS